MEKPVKEIPLAKAQGEAKHMISSLFNNTLHIGRLFPSWPSKLPFKGKQEAVFIEHFLVIIHTFGEITIVLVKFWKTNECRRKH